MVLMRVTFYSFWLPTFNSGHVVFLQAHSMVLMWVTLYSVGSQHSFNSGKVVFLPAPSMVLI